jgi:AcrR family transcriptional regulator
MKGWSCEMTVPPCVERKIDRRIQRTRQALRKALVELVEEKGYDAISVEEITKRANLGRATFYLHYKDKEDILLEEFNDRVSDQVRLISEIPAVLWGPHNFDQKINEEKKALSPMLMIFKHAAENADFYRAMLRGETSKRIADRINEIIVQSFYEITELKFPDIQNRLAVGVSFELIAVFFSGAFLSVMAWWLDQDPISPPEEMARTFQQILLPAWKGWWKPV